MGKVLHNIYNKKELKQKLQAQPEVHRITLSFYRYVKIENPEEFRDKLYSDWFNLGIWGRIYLAHEGFNGQISVPEEQLEPFKKYVEASALMKGMRLNYAAEDNGKSFFKLAVKVREKIVADGLNDDLFDPSDTGTHLSAEEFNKLTDDPDTLIIDMRNHYEYEVGHFHNALHPDADTFREALTKTETLLSELKAADESDIKERKIIMYCTGGIRCEKAGAWFKHIGYQNVYQLNGGIIQYAREVMAAGLTNKFIGKNFVFDERLGERISDEIISRCHQCGEPCDNHHNCINEACHLLFIQCDKCKEKYNACCSDDCKNFIAKPIEEQRILRKGIKKKVNFYRKGRSDLAFATPTAETVS